MKAQVTENGVTIPRQFLEGVQEVEIRSTDGVILVTPLRGRKPAVAQPPPTREALDEAKEAGPLGTLAERQFRLAKRYPEDWVVLVEERIVHHSPHRSSAFRAFDEAFTEFPGARPVLVEPGGSKRPMPIVRGRSIETARLR